MTTFCHGESPPQTTYGYKLAEVSHNVVRVTCGIYDFYVFNLLHV